MVEIVVDYLGKLVIIFLGELDGLLFGRVVPKILRRKISVFAIKEPPFIR